MTEKFFSNMDILRSTAQGGLILLITSILFWYEYSDHALEKDARTIAYGTLILSNFGLIIADLSRGRPAEIFRLLSNKTNLLVLTGFLLTIAFLFSFPPVVDFLKLAPLNVHIASRALVASFLTSTSIGLWNWLRA